MATAITLVAWSAKRNAPDCPNNQPPPLPSTGCAKLRAVALLCRPLMTVAPKGGYVDSAYGADASSR